MIGGDRHPSSAASTNNSNQASAHNLIRSILFRHTHTSNHSGTAKSDASTLSSRHPTTATSAATSRTANSSLETSPNHPLCAARGQGAVGMRVTPHQPSSGGTSSSSSNSRKHFPKFPSLLLGHQGSNHHHRHQQYQPTTTATTGGSNNPSVVRYAVPRKSGVWGRYHRTVGGLSASGHRRQAAAARRRQEAHKVTAHRPTTTATATATATAGGVQVESSQEVARARHAQIHPRPGVPQDQAHAPTTGNGNTNPQAVNLVANLRHANHITADQPPYTNVPPHHQPPSTLPANAATVDPLHKSSSSAAIPIPSHHIKRTASELQLCEDEMRAEYRDRVMYVRCYPAIAGATTARRATMQAASAVHGIGYQQGQGQGMQHQDQVPTNNLIATAAAQQATCRRSTAPPVLSHDSGDADWLLYDDHPLVGSSPSSCGAGAGAGADAGVVIERSANPRMSYADDVEAEVQVESSPSGSPIVQNPTPPKDVKVASAVTNTEGGAGGGWPVACSQTRRNISILRQASETVYSTTKTSTTATTSAATTGTTTTPSSSNPASRATSRTTSREEADFDPYYQDDDGDGYLEGELHDYEHPHAPQRVVGGGGPMQPKSADGGRRKNSASSYEDVFVIDDL